MMSICKLCKVIKKMYSCDECIVYETHDTIEKVVRSLVKNDCYLMENNVNEPAQTHKLAEYLQKELPEYNVDCEYDRKLDGPKKLDFSDIVDDMKRKIKDDRLFTNYEQSNKNRLIRQLDDAEYVADENNPTEPAFLLIRESKTKKAISYIKKVYPDIIAHLRGTMTNKIVIEAKKESNTKSDARFYDLFKLGLFTQKGGQYGYDIGYFIDLPSRPLNKFKVVFEKDNTVADSNVFIVKIEDLV